MQPMSDSLTRFMIFDAGDGVSFRWLESGEFPMAVMVRSKGCNEGDQRMETMPSQLKCPPLCRKYLRLFVDRVTMPPQLIWDIVTSIRTGSLILIKIFSQQLDSDMKHFLIDPRAEFLSVSKSAHRVSDRPPAILNILEKYNLHREHFIHHSIQFIETKISLNPAMMNGRKGYKCCHVLHSSSGEHERSGCQQKLIRLMLLEKRQIFASCEEINKQRGSWLMLATNL